MADNIDEIQKRAKEFLDKRRFERFKASLSLRFRIISPDEKLTLVREGKFAEPNAFSAWTAETKDLKQVLSEDISLGGIKIATPHPLPPKSELWINLMIPQVPIAMNSLAEVCWCRPIPGGGSYQSGLRFSAINKQDLDKVENFLKLQKSAPPRP
jgi:hypothetical protein